MEEEEKKGQAFRVLADDEFGRLTPQEKLVYLAAATKAVRGADGETPDAKDEPAPPPPEPETKPKPDTK